MTLGGQKKPQKVFQFFSEYNTSVFRIWEVAKVLRKRGENMQMSHRKVRV